MKRFIHNLQNLSLYLQQDNISIADAYTRVESAKVTLTQLLNKDDTGVSVALESETLSGEKLLFRGSKPSSNLLHKTIEDTLTALDSRFPPSKLISATLVSSFKNWPHLNEDQLTASVFGDQEVTGLYNHFSPVAFPDDMVSLVSVMDEWSTLRTLVYKKYSDLKDLKWEHVMSTLSDHNLENIFTLIDIVLALPPTSVKCETAFSAMKLLKTKRRGRLGNQRLNDLMAIKIMSASIEEFDPEPAIVDWLMSTPSGQKRRIGERTVRQPLAVTVQESESSVAVTDEVVIQESGTEPMASVMHQQVTTKEYDDSDSDEDEFDDEMSEDLVFELLSSYSRE